MSYPTPSHDTIIIGAGLSGLACALKLQAAGQRVLLLEREDAAGGRVRTDEVDGFLLDRGFQVFLDAYPTASELLDLEALDLRHFLPGAMVRAAGGLHSVMDVFRRPQELFPSALAPIGTIFDKLKVARLRHKVLGLSLEEISHREELSTEEYLRKLGFSERMIDVFFRSFYGGIFLERGLQTSSRMFEFTFKMFSQGSATLPAKGMQQIPNQLAQRLTPASLRCNATISTIDGTRVILDSGETFTARQVVLAVPSDAANELLPHLDLPLPHWRSVTNLYFDAAHSPLTRQMIALAGDGQGLINNLCVPSLLSPHYAPSGRHLISISCLGLPAQEGLVGNVLTELRDWFDDSVLEWRHLRTDVIKQALPEHSAQNLSNTSADSISKPPLYFCGDQYTSASIEGAIISGQQTATQILDHAIEKNDSLGVALS